MRKQVRLLKTPLLIAALLAAVLGANASSQPPPTKGTKSQQAGPRIRIPTQIPPPRLRVEAQTQAAAPIGALSIPDGFWWDSGEQQCQTGSYKLVYHYRMQPSTVPGFQWELRFRVKSEGTDWNGHWKSSPTLYRLYYFFNYVGGAAPTIEGNYELNHGDTVEGVLFRGNEYFLFDTRVLTLKRHGGSSGIEVTWPNTQGCIGG